MIFGPLILFNLNPKKNLKKKMKLSRADFIKHLKSGEQKIHIRNDLELNLYQLFEFLKTNHGLNPIAAGNEGEVFKFGDGEYAFIVKILKIPNETEFFFNQWLSTEVSEKGKSTAFPFFIASHRNMIALEFIEHMSFFPNYLFKNLITEKDVQYVYDNYATVVSNIAPESRNLHIKSIFIQVIHGLYLIQGVNLHGFRHGDLHGRNVLIRKGKCPPLPFFSDDGLKDLVLPDLGIEAVISDFGHSYYAGIGRNHQFVEPFSYNNDVNVFLDAWKATFAALRWSELVDQTDGLQRLFKRTFPSFASILKTAMFRGVFTTIPSRKDPKDLYVSLPPGTKRYAMTKKIADAWIENSMPLEIRKIQSNDRGVDIDTFIANMERYLRIPRELYSLMNEERGLRMLIQSLPIDEEELAMEESLVLSDFSDSNLDEILEVLDLGVSKYVLAFAIKNNVLDYNEK